MRSVIKTLAIAVFALAGLSVSPCAADDQLPVSPGDSATASLEGGGQKDGQ